MLIVKTQEQNGTQVASASVNESGGTECEDKGIVAISRYCTGRIDRRHDRSLWSQPLGLNE